MNTKLKLLEKKNWAQETRQPQGAKKQGRNQNAPHEHEVPEMRLTR
jgi:hypothetical protein